MCYSSSVWFALWFCIVSHILAAWVPISALDMGYFLSKPLSIRKFRNTLNMCFPISVTFYIPTNLLDGLRGTQCSMQFFQDLSLQLLLQSIKEEVERSCMSSLLRIKSTWFPKSFQNGMSLWWTFFSVANLSQCTMNYSSLLCRGLLWAGR